MYNLLKLMKADILGTAFPERVSCMEDLFMLVKDMEENDSVFRIKDLNISGRDLMDIGVPQGKEIGYWLNCLLEAVVETVLRMKKTSCWIMCKVKNLGNQNEVYLNHALAKLQIHILVIPYIEFFILKYLFMA